LLLISDDQEHRSVQKPIKTQIFSKIAASVAPTVRARRARALALPAIAERAEQEALFVDGKNIREKPVLERKKTLKAILPRDPLLRYSEHVGEFGKREFAKAQRAHEEGVIAKRAAGLYYSGKRTREWLKFKAVHEQEVVIVVTLSRAGRASTSAPWCLQCATKRRSAGSTLGMSALASTRSR
jgi:hypothetical protein